MRKLGMGGRLSCVDCHVRRLESTECSRENGNCEENRERRSAKRCERSMRCEGYIICRTTYQEWRQSVALGERRRDHGEMKHGYGK